MRYTKAELALEKELCQLLSQDLRPQERAVLQETYDGLISQRPLSYLVHHLKIDLAPLAISNHLSPAVLTFYTEISRRHLTCGPTSIWNGLIRQSSVQDD